MNDDVNDDVRRIYVEAPTFWVGARWSLGEVLDYLRIHLSGDEHAALLMLLAHLDGELARTAAAVAAATSPVPGLAASGPYSTADVDAIEAHRGRPYNRLRETVAERDALRAQVERVRKAALDAVAYGDDISPQDVLDALEGEP